MRKALFMYEINKKYLYTVKEYLKKRIRKKT